MKYLQYNVWILKWVWNASSSLQFIPEETIQPTYFSSHEVMGLIPRWCSSQNCCIPCCSAHKFTINRVQIQFLLYVDLLKHAVPTFPSLMLKWLIHLIFHIWCFITTFEENNSKNFADFHATPFESHSSLKS